MAIFSAVNVAPGQTAPLLTGGVTTAAPSTALNVPQAGPSTLGNILAGGLNLAGSIVGASSGASAAAYPTGGGLIGGITNNVTTVAPPPPVLPNNTITNTSNQTVPINYAPTSLMAILAGGGGSNIPELPVRPGLNLLAQFPNAMAALPDDDWSSPNRVVSDSPQLIPAERAPIPPLQVREPGPLPDLEVAHGRRPSPSLDDLLNAPVPQVNDEQNGFGPPPPEPRPHSDWQEGPLPVYAPPMIPQRAPVLEPPPFQPAPQRQEGQGFGAGQRPQLDPADVAAHAYAGMYPYQPTADPEYVAALRRQRALQAAAMREAMQGPPQAPYAPEAPGRSFMQRMAMLNPQNRATYNYQYQQALANQQHQYAQQSANYRQAMSSAAQLSDQGLSQAGQNARSIYNSVGDILKDAYKESYKSHEPKDQTQNERYTAGTNIVKNYPVGPQRDAAIAAAAHMGVDLSDFRTVPQPPSEVAKQEGRTIRNALADQMYGQREYMNPLQRRSAEDKLTRMEATMPDFIRYNKAKADLAEVNAKLAQTYGDAKAQSLLEARQASIQNMMFSQANSSLAKANSTLGQYENAYRDYLNAPASLRPQIQKNIDARFGPADPDTGIPADVINARKAKQMLNDEIGQTRMQPGQATAQPAQVAQRQPQLMPPPPAVPAQPQAIPVQTAQALLNQARQQLPNGTPDQIKARARELMAGGR